MTQFRNFAAARPSWPPLLCAVFAVLAGLHGALHTAWRGEKPEFVIVPEPPSVNAARAAGFGDAELYFRILAFTLQNAGDTFGRFTPLREYDYAKLSKWFDLADDLDSRSNIVPVTAGYYYSQTQHTEDVRYVVNYLIRHADRDPVHKWWWYVQAAQLAKRRLGDMKLAMEAAVKLPAIQSADMPLWAKQFPAFLHEQTGEFEESYRIMDAVFEEQKRTGRRMSEGELNFMQNFLEHRIRRPLEDKGRLLNEMNAYRKAHGYAPAPSDPVTFRPEDALPTEPPSDFAAEPEKNVTKP